MDYSEVTAAFEAGMAACQREQSAGMSDPMGGATPMDGGVPTQQPFIPPEPGEATESGVT